MLLAVALLYGTLAGCTNENLWRFYALGGDSPLVKGALRAG